jgi:hypothetical protein
MPNYIYAVPSTTIGLGVETTRGTAASTFVWEKVKGPKYKPNVTILLDDTLQGSMVEVYGAQTGLRYDGHGWDSYPYLDVFPNYLRGLLGSTDGLATKPASTTLSSPAVAGATTIATAASIAANSWIVIGSGSTQETHYTTAVTGTTAPYTITLSSPVIYGQASSTAVAGLTGHTFSLLNNTAASANQPPSYTLVDFDGEEWRQMTACQLDKFTVKLTATGLADYTISWFGNAATTPVSPTPSFTSVTPAPGWTAQVMIGGTVVPYYTDLELDFSRNVKPVPALTGSQNYYQFFADAMTCTGKVTVIEQSAAPELTDYINGTQQALEVVFSNRSNGYGCRFHSTVTEFTTGEITRGKQWVTAPLDFQMLPSATDASAGGVSPVTASVGNGQVASY